MADSLFDNRYRYDFIYPRGRSGETLRAVDTQAGNRPVVIKRPAPNDAPPIRAGQEVSILNERKALQRLAGHPVLTELLEGGQFVAGGSTPHQYIVMERAQGEIIAEKVLELAAHGDRLPQLEMLVILDNLLDLLQIAHARDIVYNDVDAKHLFWDRERYRLKLIDWGNAVFLEGDEVTPQGISRQNDVLQVGELIYFILTGGRRADVPRDAGEDFKVDFGEDSERVSPRLQAIISKALHPNTRLRYQRISDLRNDLSNYMTPIARERDTVLAQVKDRLRYNLSRNDLQGLINMLDPVQAIDPGYPPAHDVRREIMDRLRDLEVEADLDAVKIYMEGGNWNRAADLLHELGEKAGSITSGSVNLLMDFNNLLLEANPDPVPEGIHEAVAMVFDGQTASAAQTLLTTPAPDDPTRKLQWLLAERISSRMPEVLLLRPNLYRLQLALDALGSGEDDRIDGGSLLKSRAVLADIQTMLDELPGTRRTNLHELRDGYRAIVDRLTALNKLLSTVSVQRHLSNRQLPLSSLDRALNAAMALADNMHVIGRQATGSPRDATVALDSSRTIDPTSTLWKSISNLLNNLYELLQSYQTYVPSADGSDLEGWLMGAHSDLQPFVSRLFDEMLIGMVNGLETARDLWARYGQMVVQGNRAGAVQSLLEASNAVATISPTLSGWFNQLRSVVEGANYVERHAIFGGLGRALADGWEAFDRGRLADAERLGQQAMEIARDDSERDAAGRLNKLAKTIREWIDRNGINDAKRTSAVFKAVEDLFTQDEIQQRQNFASQMPSKDTYLKAMNKGLVELFGRSSTAALRLLYVNHILLGALDAHDGNLEDAEFWRDAAERILDDERGSSHTATRTLAEFIEKRREINAMRERVNQLNGRHAVPNLENVRRQIEESTETRTLAPVIHSLRELEAGLRDWQDGEFRVGGLKIDNAIKTAREGEQTAAVDLGDYIGWMEDLNAAAAELHTVARDMRQRIERREADPDNEVRNAHHRLADTTTFMLGEDYAATLINWRDTYDSFLDAYTDRNIRRSGRLSRFNELFRAMFIDRHPAYPLYRRWYEVTENAPEFPAPPTDEPTPRITEDEVQVTAYAGSRYTDDDEITQQPVDRRGGGGPPRWALFAALVTLMAIIGAVALLVLSSGDNGVGNGDGNNAGGAEVVDDDSVLPAVTDDVAESTTEATEAAMIPTESPTDEPATDTPEPSDTPEPTDTAIVEGTASETPEPSNTPTATLTTTSTLTLTPTLPPDGLQGNQDLLALIPRLEDPPWDTQTFSPDITGSWRFGTGNVVEGEDIRVSYPVGTLDDFFGNSAAARIRRAEATVALITYQPNLLESAEVYFGIYVQNANETAQNAGIYIEVAGANAVNLYQIINGRETFVRQVSLNVITPRLRLERDPVSGDITAFVNDNQVGEPMSFASTEAEIQPVLFVHNGGVILNVTSWRINLR